MNYLISRKTFEKKERIFRQKEIEFLFKNGLSFSVYPLYIIYLDKGIDLKIPLAILISVPKKHFKQAIKRNKIKRWIRETYRLNKYILWKFFIKKNKMLRIAFIYTSSTFCCYDNVKLGVIKALHLINKNYDKKMFENLCISDNFFY